MAARRRTAVRKKARRQRRRPARLGRLDRELPATLREYAALVRRRLRDLEHQIERAQLVARRRAARLLREASQRLGRLEVEGDAAWQRMAGPYRRELVRLLRRLEKAVAPPAPRGTRRRTTARKPAPHKRATGAARRAGRPPSAPKGGSTS